MSKNLTELASAMSLVLRLPQTDLGGLFLGYDIIEDWHKTVLNMTSVADDQVYQAYQRGLAEGKADGSPAPSRQFAFAAATLARLGWSWDGETWQEPADSVQRREKVSAYRELRAAIAARSEAVRHCDSVSGNITIYDSERAQMRMAAAELINDIIETL